jgi:putative ABC transport system ATP-binding protein
MAQPKEIRLIDMDGFLLSVHGLYKIYKENDIETVALRDVAFNVAPGEFVAIRGRSGAGKTTLLNMIGGLDTPNAGQVILAGRDLARMDEAGRAAYRRKHIGVVFQTGNLIPFLTALENVELPLVWNDVPRATANQRAVQLLTELGLGERMHHLAHQLSGGEAQRVGIAIALANGPGLLIADELTGELDSATTEQVMESLHDLHENHQLSLLVVTHNDHVAARAQRVLHIHDGAIKEEVSP